MFKVTKVGSKVGSLRVVNWGSRVEEEPAKEVEKLKIGKTCHRKGLHDVILILNGIQPADGQAAPPNSTIMGGGKSGK